MKKPLNIALTIMGFIVLFGWYFDIQVLKSVIEGKVSMKQGTAISFMISGIVGYINFTKLKYKESLIVVLSSLGLVLMYDLLTSTYIFNDSNILDRIFTNKKEIETYVPGIPSLGTILAFMSIHTFHLLNYKTFNERIKALLPITTFLGICGFLGHLTGIHQLYFYSASISTGMAIHTSIGLILLGIIQKPSK